MEEKTGGVSMGWGQPASHTKDIPVGIVYHKGIVVPSDIFGDMD